MADSASEAATVKRANRLALRTLRMRPKVVDHTEAGDPVFEIRSVQLILREDATHFNRLVHCSKCDRDVAGSPILAASDLDRPANTVICQDCVRKAAMPAWRPEDEQPYRAEEATPDVEQAEAGETAPADENADDTAWRLAVEAHFRALGGRVAALAESQTTEAADRGRADAETRAQLQPLLRGLEDMRSAIVAAEEGVRTDATALTELVRSQSDEIASLASALDESRADVRRAVDANTQLAQSLADMEARIAALAEAARPPVAEDPDLASTPDVQAVLDARITAAAAAIPESVEGQVATLQAEVQASLAALEERVDARYAGLAAELPMVVHAVRELVGERIVLGRRLDELVLHAAAGETRLDAITAALAHGDALMRAMEQKVQASVKRLTRLLGTQNADRPLVHAVEIPPAPDVDGAHPTPGLLDVLERQLQAAEARIAQRAIDLHRVG